MDKTGDNSTDDLDGDTFYVGGLFDLESSPAWKLIENHLSKNPSCSDSKILLLKEKLHQLHSFHLSEVDFEKKILKKVKWVVSEVGSQRMEIDKTSSKQFSNNSIIGDLKRELLKCQNEVNLALEREDKLQKEIEKARLHRNELITDIEEIRKHKSDMMEPQLIASTKELKIDIMQRTHQVENLQKDLEEKEATLTKLLEEKEVLELEVEKHTIAYAKATEMPQKILKQAEVLRDAIGSLVIENVKQTTLAQQLDKELDRLNRKKKDLEQNKLQLASECEQRRAEIFEMERQCDDIFKGHELARDQLSSQKAEKVKLELLNKKLSSEFKREHEVLLRAIREKETFAKQVRRLITTMNNIKLSAPTIQRQFEDFRRELDSHHREHSSIKKQISTLRKEVDLSLYEFLKQEQLEKSESEKLSSQLNDNKVLEDELNCKVEEISSLRRQLEVLSIEKDLKARDLVRLQNKYRSIKETNTRKDILIADASKSCSEAVNRLKEFGTLYEVVKNERNRYLNQTQATTQRAAEMKEKIKILSNEIEILRQEIMNKDRELSKKRQENIAAYSVRDAAKNEANKLLSQYRDRRDHIDQHLSRIETLNMLIGAAEQDMISLKSRYESAAKERNNVGIHLLDRNDELCILYERLNVQENIQKKGEEMLLGREDEIRKLEIMKNEIKRVVELLKKKVPFVADYDEELCKLQEELDNVKHNVVDLSTKMESPNDPNRCRDLGGIDPTQKELTEKIKLFEESLAEKEEKILEKDLIFEEVSTLTNRLKKQTLEGKSESNLVANRLNELTRKLKGITKCMMARVSELSMHQAMALNLYQEKNEKEGLLTEAKDRLDRGLVPSEDIEKEFINIEKARILREKELMALSSKKEAGFVAIEDDQFFVYNGIRTTAEPRPNAYIPEVTGIGELPIPKPYGSHPPFKPSELGSQFRHIKKPVIKPIEV